MSLFEDVVVSEVKKRRDALKVAVDNGRVDIGINVASIVQVQHDAEDVFSDPQTPQQAVLMDETKSLLGNLSTTVQQLMTNIEEDLVDIFV